MTGTKEYSAALPRREKEALDIVFKLGRASVAEVEARLSDSGSYSAVRMLLQRLHKRGLLHIQREGAKYIYSPSIPKQEAGRSALQKLIGTFFDGSASRAIAALIDVEEKLTLEELDALQQLIDEAKNRGPEAWRPISTKIASKPERDQT